MKRCEAVCSSSVAQWHNGTKAKGFYCIVGRMHGWIYFEILTVFSDERHTVITAQRHFHAYHSSNATRQAAHSVLGPAPPNPEPPRGIASGRHRSKSRASLMFSFLVICVIVFYACVYRSSPEGGEHAIDSVIDDFSPPIISGGNERHYCMHCEDLHLR